MKIRLVLLSLISLFLNACGSIESPFPQASEVRLYVVTEVSPNGVDYNYLVPDGIVLTDNEVKRIEGTLEIRDIPEVMTACVETPKYVVRYLDRVGGEFGELTTYFDEERIQISGNASFAISEGKMLSARFQDLELIVDEIIAAEAAHSIDLHGCGG